MNRGDRVELTEVPDEYLRFALAAGECGTVEFTDALGTVHILWDNGVRVGIITESVGCLRKIGGQSVTRSSGPDWPGGGR